MIKNKEIRKSGKEGKDRNQYQEGQYEEYNGNNNELNENKMLKSYNNSKTLSPKSKQSTNKGQNNKGYFNFIQNIKKANKNKKNNLKNLLAPEPKPKIGKALNKIKVLKGINQVMEKEIQNAEIDKNQNQLEDPLIENVRNELLKEYEEEEKLGTGELNIEKNENIDINRKESNSGYTGFVLLKQVEGKNIFQIRFEGSIEEINKIFKAHKLQLEGGPVELIYSKELEILRNSNNNKNEIKNEIEKVKESRVQNPILNNIKKKAKEEEEKKQKEEQNKIKEMEEKIQKYKNELRKGNDDIGTGKKKNEKFSYLRKNFKFITKKLIEDSLKQISINEEGLPNKKTIGIDKSEYQFIKDGPEKKPFKTIDNPSKKDKDKSYSKAMDRFKKRYKKDNSAEFRTINKSDKINEIAKQLENVIGKPTSSEMKIGPRKDIILEDNPSNFEQIVGKNPVISKKPKKIQKFQA